jgi:ATP-dependent RNA helicase RhlE
VAVSLVSHEEAGLLRDIRKLLKDEIEVSDITGYAPSQPLRLDANAPRPAQGQRQPRQPQQRQGKAPSHRPHGHAQSNGGGGESHAAGNRKRRPRRRPAAKA